MHKNLIYEKHLRQHKRHNITRLTSLTCDRVWLQHFLRFNKVIIYLLDTSTSNDILLWLLGWVLKRVCRMTEWGIQTCLVRDFLLNLAQGILFMFYLVPMLYNHAWIIGSLFHHHLSNHFFTLWQLDYETSGITVSGKSEFFYSFL